MHKKLSFKFIPQNIFLCPLSLCWIINLTIATRSEKVIKRQKEIENWRGEKSSSINSVWEVNAWNSGNYHKEIIKKHKQTTKTSHTNCRSTDIQKTIKIVCTPDGHSRLRWFILFAVIPRFWGKSPRNTVTWCDLSLLSFKCRVNISVTSQRWRNFIEVSFKNERKN